MANVKIDNLALKKGEYAMMVGDILTAKANGSSEFDDLFAIGEGKGIPFEFKENEEIVFSKFEQAPIIVRISKLNGKEYKLLSTIAASNLRGDIEIPMSIFRRVPAFPEDLQKLIEGHTLTEELLQNNIGDFTRLQTVSGHKVCVIKALKLTKVTFKTVGGKVERVDVSKLPAEERKTMNFYQVKFA